ncbi:MAG: putative integral rane protein, partial [Microbacterium sp.]|nr:putative integral rane protein [Microbacterium sp.]
IAVTAALLFARPVRRVGVEIRLWSAAYLLYLLAVFFPQSSLFRLLVPLSPLWGAVAAPRSIVWRLGVLAAVLAAQWCWIYNMYALGDTFWRVP